MIDLAYKEKTSRWEKTPLCYPAEIAMPGRTIIEIGPGRGDFLFHLAEKNPGAAVIAIEMKSKRYFKLIDRVIDRKFANVQLIQADGRIAISTLFDAGTVDEIHINFPDPWPKNKHQKNRLFTSKFIKDCLRVLRSGGILSFITDWKDYADEVNKRVSTLNCGLKSVASDMAEVYPTYFAQKWQKMGRTFNYLQWQKD